MKSYNIKDQSNLLLHSLVILLIINIFLIGCTVSGIQSEFTESKEIPGSPLLYATLYSGYASEYKALSYQAYNVAMERLYDIHRESPDKKNLAVVLDLDETVLDNSPYQAKLIADNIQYPTLWNEWCLLESAKAVPGSLEFCRLADSLGFHIIYLSNRKENFVRDATENNLRKLGFPQLFAENIILRNGPSSKEARRNLVAEKFDIIMLIGDNIGDFYEDEGSAEVRDRTVIARRSEFGKRFIALPNAMYGNWVESLGVFDHPEQVKILLDSMTLDFKKLK